MKRWTKIIAYALGGLAAIVLVLLLAGAVLFYQAATPQEGNTEIAGTYRYDVSLTTDAVLRNVTLIIPLPVHNDTSAIGEILSESGGYGVPDDWNLSVRRQNGTPMLVVAAANITPIYAPLPIAVTAGEEPAGAVKVTYSSAYSDATPILLPYSFGATVDGGSTYYTADLDAGPIDTKHPLDTEPVLAPKGNLTPAADGRRYTYDCPLYLSCDAPATANLTLSIRFSGSNEWWLLGWSSNAYTDLILAEIQGENGWRRVRGTLSTGEGRYFHGDPSPSPRFFSLQSGKDQNDIR
ncbi:hypothetical protein Metli_0579 [Methanofollis liminatans DSM 4140]|uniref:Uncharacterized protein n=1 Tax=Methanofollis liminatans DSM 4140 TaxID=28892 RepID=J0RYC1_9EURY|nr:hypothetical protein [Methanofollis liminatans]EJG06546.1 hypothetical protein Metli_0579 [Methanofollis liminatans DSM 4140]